jgi:hypothetical protein
LGDEDGRRVLKCIFGKQVVRMRTGLNWHRIWTVVALSNVNQLTAVNGPEMWLVRGNKTDF